MIHHFGPFTLNSDPLVLMRAGELVPLPPKALELLLFLLERQGQIITKDEIFRHVWRDTHVVESSLTKYISILRKAIDNPDEASFIENLSKRGYRLLADPVPTEKLRFNWMALRVASVLVSILAGGAYWWNRPKAAELSRSDVQVLIGRQHWNRMNPEELNKALKRFELAAALDPKAALPQAGIADSNLMLAHFGFKDPATAIADARAANRKTLELDPNLASGHVCAAMLAIVDLNWQKAAREIRIAQTLDPQSAAVHRASGFLHTYRGDLAAARKSFQQSLAIDPLSAWTSVSLAKVEYFDHHFDRALFLLNDLIDREPNFSLALYYRALTQSYVGRPEEALRDLRKSGLNSDLIATDEAWIQARAGNPSPARALLAQRLQMWRRGKAPPTAVTILAIASVDRALALESIDAFTREKHLDALNLVVDPRFDPLRGEAAFPQFLDRIRVN